ncbi:uncharacterized protein ACNLHF_000525 [Anomaloglossus baeobatrachus]|uniref:uncharacterized protein LOC142250531 n=1 Tax=Anomaloglossus baeobatrachus TaxID=238106 RepID=UPI003F507207
MSIHSMNPGGGMALPPAAAAVMALPPAAAAVMALPPAAPVVTAVPPAAPGMMALPFAAQVGMALPPVAPQVLPFQTAAPPAMALPAAVQPAMAVPPELQNLPRVLPVQDAAGAGSTARGRRRRGRGNRSAASDSSSRSRSPYRRRRYSRDRSRRSAYSERRSRSSRRSRRSRSSRWRSPSTTAESSGDSITSSRRSRRTSSRRRDAEPYLVQPQAADLVTAPHVSVNPTDAPAVEISAAVSSGTTRGNVVSTQHMGPAGMQLMPLVTSSLAPRTWLAYGAAKPVIWLLGHSYIFWAGQRAENRPGGRALGFRGFEVNWRGVRGLIWPQVIPEVVEIARSALTPVVLVIHAGGNDLGARRLAELITTMRSDVDKFHAFFPELVLVWSEVISRPVWRGAEGAAALERSRRTLNSRISRFVRFKAGIVVRHWQLEGDNSSLMLNDGVHLNNIGLDIFLSGLQDGIEQALFIMGGGRSTV